MPRRQCRGSQLVAGLAGLGWLARHHAPTSRNTDPCRPALTATTPAAISSHSTACSVVGIAPRYSARQAPRFDKFPTDATMKMPLQTVPFNVAGHPLWHSQGSEAQTSYWAAD